MYLTNGRDIHSIDFSGYMYIPTVANLDAHTHISFQIL